MSALRQASSLASIGGVIGRNGPSSSAQSYLQSQRNLLELTSHGKELLNVPPCAYEILCLDLARAHLPVLGARLDLLDKRLLLLLELNARLVEFPDRLIEHALVLAQTLRGRHALAKSPF